VPNPIKYHGEAYRAWKHMLSGCENPNTKHYRFFGGKGVTVCRRWTLFENFLADMGDCPSETALELINADGRFEPANCRWASTYTPTSRYVGDRA
jgi:hypothetical protein